MQAMYSLIANGQTPRQQLTINPHRALFDQDRVDIAALDKDPAQCSPVFVPPLFIPNLNGLPGNPRTQGVLA